MDVPLGVAHVLRRKGDKAQADRLLDGILAATAPVPGQRTPNAWRILRARTFAERGQTAQSLAEVKGAVNAGWRTALGFESSTWLDQDPTMTSGGLTAASAAATSATGRRQMRAAIR